MNIIRNIALQVAVLLTASCSKSAAQHTLYNYAKQQNCSQIINYEERTACEKSYEVPSNRKIEVK